MGPNSCRLWTISWLHFVWRRISSSKTYHLGHFRGVFGRGGRSFGYLGRWVLIVVRCYKPFSSCLLLSLVLLGDIGGPLSDIARRQCKRKWYGRLHFSISVEMSRKKGQYASTGHESHGSCAHLSWNCNDTTKMKFNGSQFRAPAIQHPALCSCQIQWTREWSSRPLFLRPW